MKEIKEPAKTLFLIYVVKYVNNNTPINTTDIIVKVINNFATNFITTITPTSTNIINNNHNNI